MTDTGKSKSMNEHASEPATEADILIGRLVDGEADEEDRADFERLADTEPRLWRAVAMRQQDMASLTEEIDHEIAIATTMELPDFVAPRRALRWGVAVSGWAAVLVVAAVWVFSDMGSPANGPVTEAVPVQQGSAVLPGNGLTADEHLAHYLQGQFVMGELDPILLETEDLSDGWTAYSYLRRIEEFVILPPDHQLPVDEKGRFITDPAQLRAAAGPPAVSEATDPTH